MAIDETRPRPSKANERTRECDDTDGMAIFLMTAANCGFRKIANPPPAD
jgi:hypothetical protein